MGESYSDMIEQISSKLEGDEKESFNEALKIILLYSTILLKRSLNQLKEKQNQNNQKISDKQVLEAAKIINIYSSEKIGRRIIVEENIKDIGTFAMILKHESVKY